MLSIPWPKLFPIKTVKKEFFLLVFKGGSRHQWEKAARRTSTSPTMLAKISASSHISGSHCNLASRLYFTCFLSLSWLCLGIFPVPCNLSGPRGCSVDHHLPSPGLPLPSALDRPRAVAASAGGHVEKAFPHCSQRGLCFMMPHSIGIHHLPWGQWQFLFRGEQWMMVASPKGNNSAWGENQQQQNNF